MSKKARDWNLKNPVGTKILYKPFKSYPYRICSTTRTTAFTSTGGEAVVSIQGKTGYIPINDIVIEVQKKC